MLATLSIPEPPDAPEGYPQIEYAVFDPMRGYQGPCASLADAVKEYLCRGTRCRLEIYATKWIDDETSETFDISFRADRGWSDWRLRK